MDFTEQSLVFTFDERWTVMKYDDEKAYREGIQKLKGSRAVDFAAFCQNRRTLYLIEVKDFRKHRIENKDRLSTGELAIEIGQKVRDSISGLIGLYRNMPDQETYAQIASMMTDPTRHIQVVVWLEQDLPDDSIQKKKALALTEADVFKSKISWLTRKVMVINQSTNALAAAGLTVRNLPNID